jgi:hypothetical protein
MVLSWVSMKARFALSHAVSRARQATEATAGREAPRSVFRGHQRTVQAACASAAYRCFPTARRRLCTRPRSRHRWQRYQNLAVTVTCTRRRTRNVIIWHALESSRITRGPGPERYTCILGYSMNESCAPGRGGRGGLARARAHRAVAHALSAARPRAGRRARSFTRIRLRAADQERRARNAEQLSRARGPGRGVSAARASPTAFLSPEPRPRRF